MKLTWGRKRYQAILLVLIFIMSSTIFAGCGSNKNNAEKVGTDQAAVTQEAAKDDNKVTPTESAVQASGLPAYDLNDGDTTLADATYNFGQVAIGGGGYVTGLISNPAEKNLIYARTDVGGAYRWVEDTKSWKSLAYSVSAADKGLLSIDGFAVDPNAPNKLYMVAGCEYFSNHKTVVYLSDDYGDTLKQIDVTNLIKVHGNGMGRQNGERIAVDPNSGNILFVGGRTGGLIKSTDGGNTWAKVDSFTVDSTDNGNGICSIVFDPSTGKAGAATQRIFAAVSRLNADNVYVSEDGGATWNAVAGLPQNFMPERMKMDADGNLLITYADAEGPWNGKSGGIYRYNPNSKKAQDISPSDGKPIGDVVTDPSNAKRMVCSTINTWMQQPNGAWGDIYYTSEDGGKTWTNILGNMTMDANGNPWIMTSSIHWSGSLMLDPNNPNRLFVTSGNGIFGCDNIWDETKNFYFNAKGLEETVPLDLVSIPGGDVLSVIGDYGGFIHKDVHEYGTLFGNANGSNSSIAVAANAPDHWVRVSSSKNVPVTYTKDGGATWAELASVPQITGNESAQGGYVAISPDASVIFWSPSNGLNTYFTKDEGQTWTQCEGLRNNTYILSDPTKAGYVYASNGKSFYFSTDGGATFTNGKIALKDYNRFSLVPGQEGVILMPNANYGLMVSTDYGKTFKKLDNIVTCRAIGTGKPKNDKRPYVIYIWGSLKSDPKTEGLFASEDNGATWVRINNDQNQFGGPGNGNFVIGDNNEYGKIYMGSVGMGIIYGEIK